MVRRGIPVTVVEAILAAPGQRIRETHNVISYQSLVDISGKAYLVRVLVNDTLIPPKVVTVYRTSKIGKYSKETP